MYLTKEDTNKLKQGLLRTTNHETKKILENFENCRMDGVITDMSKLSNITFLGQNKTHLFSTKSLTAIVSTIEERNILTLILLKKRIAYQFRVEDVF